MPQVYKIIYTGLQSTFTHIGKTLGRSDEDWQEQWGSNWMSLSLCEIPWSAVNDIIAKLGNLATKCRIV